MVNVANIPLVLIGFMGSGKSTLGRQLASLLGLVFIDLDSYIETRQRRSITDIFERDGENAFRELESKALSEILSYSRQVVAVGGGAPCHLGNMNTILANSLSVYLKVSNMELCRRLTESPSPRPLLKGKTAVETMEFITNMVETREVYYKQADVVIESDLITAEMILSAVEKVQR
jgi:shikimate kinase